jgi:anti-sigma factor RsiW
MSCSEDDLKDFIFGELDEAARGRVEAHIRECRTCQEELDRLRLTGAALNALREEEMPRRIAFVSDPVFEPRWWQRLWQSGPKLGFASAAMLSLALVFNAVYRPAPQAAPAVAADPAVIEQRVNAELARRIGPAIEAAVAASEARQAKKTAELIAAAQKEAAFERQADRARIEEAFDYIRKKLGTFYMASANLGSRQ